MVCFQARTSVVSTLTMRIRSQNARIRYLTKEVATLRSVVEGSGGVQLIETSVSALKSVLDGLASDRRANLPSPAPSRAETRGRHLSNSSGTQDDRLPPRATDTLRARPVAQQLGNADNVLPHSLNTQTQRIDARSQRIDVHAHGMNPHSDILAMTPIDDDEMTVASEDASKGEKFAMSMTPPVSSYRVSAYAMHATASVYKHTMHTHRMDIHMPTHTPIYAESKASASTHSFW